MCQVIKHDPTFWLSCINSLTSPTVLLWPIHPHSQKYLCQLSSTCEQKPIIKKQHIYQNKHVKPTDKLVPRLSIFRATMYAFLVSLVKNLPEMCSRMRCNFWQSFKKILYMGFRATLNFRKCKVALNPMNRKFSNFAKICILSCYQNSIIRRENFTVPLLKYKHLKL